MNNSQYVPRPLTEFDGVQNPQDVPVINAMNEGFVQWLEENYGVFAVYGGFGKVFDFKYSSCAGIKVEADGKGFDFCYTETPYSATLRNISLTAFGEYVGTEMTIMKFYGGFNMEQTQTLFSVLHKHVGGV